VLISSNVMWEDDRFVHTRCFTRDITERKRAEEELRESRSQLAELLKREQSARAEAERQRDFTRLVLEDAPIAIGVMEGPEHRFVFVNRKTCELTGLSEEQFAGRAHAEVLPEADEVVAPVLDRVYATGRGETQEVDVVLPKGRRQLLITWTALPGRDGNPGSVLYLSLDITDRKAAEEAVRENEGRLRTLADAMPQLVWMADTDGYIFWYNQRWYDYTGTSPEQMEGWGWQSLHDPEMLPLVMERWRASIETGEPFEMEFPLKGADGVFRWFLTRVNPLRDSHGRIVRWFGTNTDVDEQRRTAEELREANRLKDEFLATVSHELRTPLTAILGWAHILRVKQFDEESSAHALETIERNAYAQAQLINDLLDVSRIITGKLRLDVRQVEPGSLIEAAVEALRPAAEAKDIRIQKVLDTGVVSVAGDPARLQQVVWNLLSNAVKFTPKGGSVQVELGRIDSHIEIAVSDTGAGINTEFLPHVFERFRQADQSTTRHHGGLGLGLAIVRHLVELHGGTVEADSPGEGQGATFVVKLPAVAVYQKETGAGRAHPAAGDSLSAYDCPERLDGLKVLVVDDEVDTRELFKAGIGRCGAEVVTAGSAREALAILEEMRPDLLISDIGMPGEDGYELIRKVRALPAARGGKIPAIALTAYARTEDRMRALRAGYQMHIVKPVELAELVAVMASLIGRSDKAE
jgi:PAS domain S-box-containing protein